MGILRLADDFKEFLKLLNSNGVEYLLIGGYAVGIYGYVRATNDLDVWVREPQERPGGREGSSGVRFRGSFLDARAFPRREQCRQEGVPPMRLEILTSISGVNFEQCYAEKFLIDIEEIEVPVISLDRLRDNKFASGRAKDLADLDNLPNQPDRD
jgi:hypothetical protein